MRHLSNLDKVREFHRAFGLPDGTGDLNDPDQVKLRYELILEEFKEFAEELFPIYPFNKEKLLKELVDLLYVVYGTAVHFGLDVDLAFNLVHESNMSKLGADGKPIYREDGKVLKGPNYKEPDLKGCV